MVLNLLVESGFLESFEVTDQRVDLLLGSRMLDIFQGMGPRGERMREAIFRDLEVFLAEEGAPMGPDLTKLLKTCRTAMETIEEKLKTNRQEDQ